MTLKGAAGDSLTGTHRVQLSAANGRCGASTTVEASKFSNGVRVTARVVNGELEVDLGNSRGPGTYKVRTGTARKTCRIVRRVFDALYTQ